MATFFGIIFFIIIGFYLLGLLGRLLIRFLIMRKMKQFGMDGEGAGGAYGAFGRTFTFGGRREPQPKKEGEVTITGVREERKVSEQVGEYVEYEEEK